MKFASPRVEYLGHIISKRGMASNPSKLNAMADWPIPSYLKQLRGFIGLAGCHRHFVQNFGQIAKPLMNLLKKDKFLWSDSTTEASNKLK